MSVSHRLQHVKLPKCTDFHTGIAVYTIYVLTAQVKFKSQCWSKVGFQFQSILQNHVVSK